MRTREDLSTGGRPTAVPSATRGLSNGEIAATCTIEEGTVKTHVNRILTELGHRSRVHAAIYAHEHGLVACAPTRRPGVPRRLTSAGLPQPMGRRGSPGGIARPRPPRGRRSSPAAGSAVVQRRQRRETTSRPGSATPPDARRSAG
ncbi:response regulator transcription factor [Nonomuraea spiralis]|uniref:response regulator transcription factor n=1 Tax=Nonomuraea spiralis TaxID=46182 RepID=UPI0037B7ED97